MKRANFLRGACENLINLFLAFIGKVATFMLPAASEEIVSCLTTKINDIFPDVCDENFTPSDALINYSGAY
jgi:hypothetical protein